MPGLREAAAAIAARRGGKPPSKARFLPLETTAAAPLAGCVAVDGSHAVLVDNGAFWVVAVRVAAVTWPAAPPSEQEPTVHAATPAEGQDALDKAYLAWGLEPPLARSAEAFAQALRSLQEAQAAVQAISSLAPGRLLLVDGALHGLPPGPQAAADRIVEAAQRRGVLVVGVSKRSALEQDGVPLPAFLQRSGPPGAWVVEVEPGVHVARLHPRSPAAFRIDAPDLTALAQLTPMCNDAVYVGYPYPLALAHNAVALTGAHVRDLRARLREETRRVGGAAAAELLADFHDVLDRNVSG